MPARHILDLIDFVNELEKPPKFQVFFSPDPQIYPQFFTKERCNTSHNVTSLSSKKLTVSSLEPKQFRRQTMEKSQ